MSISEATGIQQYLTFQLNQETFAVEVGKVREILDVSTITKVPQTPGYVRGVINLRGGVVPVIDLRQRFGMPRAEDTVNTCIIVVEVSAGGESIILGTLADSVQEVFDLDSDQIEPAPRIGIKLDTEFVKGMGKHSGGFIIILDIDKLFSSGGLDLARQSEEEAA